MKKCRILFLFLLLISVGVSAQGRKTLVVEMRDGSSASFMLVQKPTITFTGTLMSVVSASSSLEIERTDVKQYYFETVTTSVEEVVEEAQAVVSGNAVSISGLPANADVTVYAGNGVQVLSEKAVDGCCKISLDTLPNALYIVNYNKTSIKILKK
ncbi:MAG: hypothetical protein IKZ37_00885 [Bacteroidaceae bacterium]|nr:hypothetical protein [Bacteroidaceae bacterium]